MDRRWSHLEDLELELGGTRGRPARRRSAFNDGSVFIQGEFKFRISLINLFRRFPDDNGCGGAPKAICGGSINQLTKVSDVSWTKHSRKVFQ